MDKAFETRHVVSILLSLFVGLVLLAQAPFPEDNGLLQLIGLEKPYLFYSFKWTYLAMLFTTPYIGLSFLFSFAYIFVPGDASVAPPGKLPPYPEANAREKLFLVLGELHHA